MALHYGIKFTADEIVWLDVELHEMKELYDDPKRSGLYDADDIAKEVAYFIASKLGIE